MRRRWARKPRSAAEKLATNQPYIPVETYFAICREHIEFDENGPLFLSRFLHDLGVFLHFQDDPLLFRTVILQNDWATNAVFRLLDDETVKSNFGRFTRKDCARVWKDSAYAQMHLELLTLMQKFELCYELRDSTPPTWIVPQLLPPSKAVKLGDWRPQPDDLVLRYKYDFLPRGMISRLMVRLHRFVADPQMAWVTGVLFEHETTKVLVEILANGAEIEIRARGPERQGLLRVVAADLDVLNESFRGLFDRVEKCIPCNCTVCRAAAAPVFFDQKQLLYRKEHKKLKVECPRSFQDVDVLELLDGIKAQIPSWAKDERIAPSVRTIRIFLASSSELREDRDELELFFRQHNDQLVQRGHYLKIVRWEHFLDAMLETRIQYEYDEAIRDCDVFVSLLSTKTGKYTEEGFEVTHRQFKNTDKPLIYIFFRDLDIKADAARKEDIDSLRAFQEKLKKLGHFHTSYDSIEHLKLKFGDLLDTLLVDVRSR
jgi:hypothetical protein